MNLGNEIKKIRKQRNLTQKQLASKISAAEITIRQYEANKRQPTIEQLHNIASALDVSVNDLLSGDLDLEVKSNLLQGAEELLPKFLHKLTLSQNIGLLTALNATIDYIGRATSDEQERTIIRLSDVIERYGKMILEGFEMRWATSEHPDDYLIFLRHYDRIMQLIHEHKEEIICGALHENERLEKLIYGEGDSK